MEKDVKWLKKELQKCLATSINRDNHYSYGNRDAYSIALSYVDELDEPEQNSLSCEKGERDNMEIQIVRADGIWEIQITKNKSTNFIVLDKTQMEDLYNMVGDELYSEEAGFEIR